MAVRGTIPRRLLLPLLVFWAGSAVESQTVNIANVTTEHFELIWEREGEWHDIGDYTVNMVLSDGTQHPCNNEPFSCTTPVCRYQSLSCGLLNPCSSVNVSVSGGNYTTRDLFLTTAPQAFTDVTVVIESANLTISWMNPAAEESTCLVEAKILLELNNIKTAVNSSGLHGFYWQALCKETLGQVRLWNVGGDGESDFVLQNISYQGSDVVPLVDNITVIPGCTNLTVTWVYNNVCPEATYLRIFLLPGESYYTKDTTSTKHVFNGLEKGMEFAVIFTVLDKDNCSLGINYYASTQTLKDMVEDFTVEAVSWSAIASTWLPLPCNSDPIMEYTVTLLDISSYHYWVTDQVDTTNYTWHKLRNNHRYTVCVEPIRGNESCLSLNTLLERPNMLRVEDSPRGELLLTWTYDNCPYEGCYSVIYNVSWGPALENFVVTFFKKYTINGYNANAEDRKVCVAAINPYTHAVSANTCLGDHDVDPIIPTMEPTASSPANPGLILGLSCAAIILGAGVVVSVVVRIRNKNRLPFIRTTSRPTEVNNANVAKVGSENGRPCEWSTMRMVACENGRP